ncbi:MAG TPA: hypothetical protein DHW71_11830 [Gammaproteobacteria bacterium]|nr:hypothetical protein [Gammaproteobacteria bacterium]HBF07959.1 hypothetical protein [Gammaproteobacteria bacterium]HCK93675.1 hypothetical protein [Gammaproteobacteria bacterium]|tara:strand:+ start:628 stop:1230 length:603 start_codon:yes stop_codon:yes gene_type:complete
MSKQAQFTVNLNFANQSIEQTDEYAVFNINDFYDVHEASVSASELKGFVEESFEARLQKERQAIEAEVRKEYEAKINEELAARKLEINANYVKKISNIVGQVKKVLMSEFSITDPYALEALVAKCLHNLDEEKPDFIFVSKENFDVIKEKLEHEKINVLGTKIPIAIGHGLNNDQVMIEGQSSVVVSDLGALIDNYFTNN